MVNEEKKITMRMNKGPMSHTTCVLLVALMISCTFLQTQAYILPNNSVHHPRASSVFHPRHNKVLHKALPTNQQGDQQEDRLPRTDKVPCKPQQSLSSSRRNLFLASAASAATSALSGSFPALAAEELESSSSSNSVYRAAVRPTAYRVDSTIPPTLLPLSSAREQLKILKALAAGSGTDKGAVLVDTVNLNNMLNKAVFGSAQWVASQFSPDDSKVGEGYASYVCIGVPAKDTSADDIDLASSLLSAIVAARPKSDNRNTALGLHWAPISTQPALDQYSQSRNYDALAESLKQAGVDDATLNLYRPLLTSPSLQGSVDWLALSPEFVDLKTAITQGLQQVDPGRRSRYVVDPQGFISLTQDKQFKLYTDRSLLKDVPSGVKEGDFFAQRILAHETAATVCARYAQTHSTSGNGPTPLVALVAPIPDLRYIVGGMNGRLSRISNVLGLNKVSTSAVTTILCNPTALETLSKSRYLRLEIGTGPDTVELQAKVADYLWFSKSPKVNLIPRLMEKKNLFNGG